MRLFSKSILMRLGWTTVTYGVLQVLRVLNNVVLARLLAPELFGLMLIVNTLRVGIELVSDLGVGQNIISSKDAEEPRYYNTAWTLQVGRGLLLGMVSIALARPIAWFYGNPALTPIFIAAALVFIFAGLESISRTLLHKRLELAKLGVLEVCVSALAIVLQVVLAILSKSVWALVIGGISASAMMMVGTYLLVPGFRQQFVLDRDAIRKIFGFGRWVFVASIVYFLAMNFDRLYMARSVSLAVLGTYGIARSLADMLNLFAQRVGMMVIFPMVAASFDSVGELRRRLARHRPAFVLLTALVVAGFAATSDIVVTTLYDHRYHAAAWMLPVLSVGVWFTIIGSVNESVLLGIGRPAYGAVANAVKMAWLLTALPLGVHFYGVPGAVCAVAGADMIRYVPLWWAQKREGLSFARQDAIYTVVMLGAAVGLRAALGAIGLGSGVASLWRLPWG